MLIFLSIILLILLLLYFNFRITLFYCNGLKYIRIRYLFFKKKIKIRESNNLKNSDKLLKVKKENNNDIDININTKETKEYIQKFPFKEMYMVHEDLVTWLRILEYEPFAYGIDEPLLIYRISDRSKSGNKLTAARMQWNAYAEIGLKQPDKIRNMVFYIINGIVKYSKMRGRSNK